MMQQKVQFFQSESQFGSQSSLQNSRILDVGQQVDMVFTTLKKQLLPTKQKTNYDNIEYIVNRANILSHDIIPQQLQQLQKYDTQNRKIQTQTKYRNFLQKLNQLKYDYQLLKNNSFTHKQFYTIYCKNTQSLNFEKYKSIYNHNQNQIDYQSYNDKNHILRPDIVQVNLLSSRKLNNGSQHRISNNLTLSKAVKDKQLKELQEQVNRLKQHEQTYIKNTQNLLSKQKQNNQKRINNIIQSISSKSQITQLFKKQLKLKQNQIESLINKNNNLIDQNQKLKNKCQILEQKLLTRQQELAQLKKLQMLNFEDLQWKNNQSAVSQLYTVNDKNKSNSNFKKIQTERDLLKYQLVKQREKHYNIKLRNTQYQSKQLNRVKKLLDQLTKKQNQTEKQFDKVRIQSIQLKQENNDLKKQFSIVKQTNQHLKSKADTFKLGQSNITEDDKSDRIRKKTNDIESSRLLLAKFNEYQGQGIEGYPYFQLLSRQFRIRFKRACLKQKQLLYKNHGLEVGVITQFYAPNFMKVNVHLTNYGQKIIQYLKIKVINPNQNKIDCQVCQLNILNINQQTKLPISCVLKNYPIGPVVLILEYQAQTKHDLRLLLPVHIFKCVNISQRTEKLLKLNTFLIKAQRKICKDEATLKQYFNCQSQQQIKVKIKHQHSNSSLFLNVFYQGQSIRIQYQHHLGYNNFTEYFIKTLKTILQKLN